MLVFAGLTFNAAFKLVNPVAPVPEDEYVAPLSVENSYKVPALFPLKDAVNKALPP